MSEVMVVESPRWITQRALWKDDPQEAVKLLYKCYTFKLYRELGDHDYLVKVKLDSEIEPITRNEFYEYSMRPIHCKANKLAKYGPAILSKFEIQENTLLYVFEKSAMAMVYEWMSLHETASYQDWHLEQVCKFIDSKGLASELAEFLKSK
jgi:hypothetical protein